MATGQETDDIDPPQTAAQALDLAISDGATALISAAVLLAIGGEVLPQGLFVAALAVGWTDAPSSAYVRSSVAAGHPVADSWLYEWFAKTAGPDTVDQLVRDEVGKAFPVPLLPSMRQSIVSQASKLAADVRLSPAAGALLGRASRFAWHIQRDHRYGVRHIVASLILPDANRTNAGIEDLVFRRTRIRLADAGSLITANASRGGEPPDAVKVWQEIIADPPPTPTPDSAQPGSPPPTARPFITLSGFTSDGVATGDGDPLGIMPDVRAFARLICLEQATPPLSICLFGAWGSGKSTFMERLYREIAELTQSTHGLDQAAAAETEDPTFVENIVQIKFNAWHFADANLWASLTAVFFDQLRRGGHDNDRAADYQILIGKVADRVRSLDADAAHALVKVEDAQRRSDSAQAALATVEKQLAASDFALAWSQIRDDLKTLQDENSGKLKAIGRQVYRDDLSTDTRAFAAAVAEAASTPGQVALIGRILIGGGLPTWLAVLAILLIGCIGIALPAIDPTVAGIWFQRIAAWGAGSFAALGALWQAFKTAKPVLDGAWKYAKAVEDARTRLTREVEAKRQEVSRATQQLNADVQDLAKARKPLAVYRDEVLPDAPSTILRYFLFEDGDVRDYDSQVGIVSRARRSFEQLNSIIAAARKAAKQPRTAGPGFPVPDRIVLYIDDLDRCTHEQVYAVLQAIHLLLSFEHFVVVVGVDVDWIEGAVAKHFEADLTRPRPEPDIARADPKPKPKDDPASRPPKRATDYLEKIFQIPFWLAPLNVGNGTASKSSYAAYVESLLENNKPRPAPGPAENPTSGAATDHLPEGQNTPEVRPPSEPASGPRASSASRPADLAGIERATVAAALESLKLDLAEIDYLARPEIGAIASKSPRTVKRLINIYRIVRSRLSGRELDAFLGRSGSPPRYPIAILLLAIETGQPSELASAFYSVLAGLKETDRLDFAWKTLDRGGEKQEPIRALSGVRQEPALSAAVSAVDGLCGPGATVEAYLDMARLIRRYSFNRYG